MFAVSDSVLCSVRLFEFDLVENFDLKKTEKHFFAAPNKTSLAQRFVGTDAWEFLRSGYRAKVRIV